jgi:polar amino acid transport system substrate-binding protein
MPVGQGVVAILMLAVAYLAAAGACMTQTPICEPDKVAAKYPSLAGKTIKIGADPTSPPYVTRDPKDFNQLIGFDADMARAVFDCAGVKYEFFLGGWSGLLPAVISGQIDAMWDNLYYTAERAKQVDYLPSASRTQNAKAEGKPGVNIMTYPDIAAGARLVQSGRADLMLTDLPSPTRWSRKTRPCIRAATRSSAAFRSARRSRKATPIS